MTHINTTLEYSLHKSDSLNQLSRVTSEPEEIGLVTRLTTEDKNDNCPLFKLTIVFYPRKKTD